MSREERRACTGAVRGAGMAVEAVDVGRDSDANEAGGERGGVRGEGRAEAGGKAGAAGALDDGVTAVERNAVKRGEERTVTGTSSKMLEGTSLFSIRL